MGKGTTSLYYSDGKSDKEYHAQLESKDDGYVVNFQYGRRGSTLRAGTKTAKPVGHDQAKLIYDKLVSEKISKGYSPGEDGVQFQNTDLESRKTGIIPQLLNSISEQELTQYINDNNYALQEKHDGERRLLQITKDTVTGINRRGLSIPLPAPIANVLLESGHTHCVLDGEALGDTIIIFDVLEDETGCIRQKSYAERLSVLEHIFSSIDSKLICMVTTAYTSEEKQQLFSLVHENTGEGVVIKDLTAQYTPGRPNKLGSQLKYKFVESASVLVSEVSQNKRSVSMSVLDKGELINIGKVTIKANQDIPNVGDILEVQYLYAYQGGSLYQPICLGLRTDIERDACVIGQLKYKSDN